MTGSRYTATGKALSIRDTSVDGPYVWAHVSDGTHEAHVCAPLFASRGDCYTRAEDVLDNPAWTPAIDQTRQYLIDAFEKAVRKRLAQPRLAAMAKACETEGVTR